MKKFLSLVLVLTLVLALAAPVFAADGGSITIKASEDGVSVDGRTFAAYKVLDVVTYSGTDKVVYAVPAALKDFYATRYSVDKAAGDFDAKVVAAIRNDTDTAAEVENFAKAVLAAAVEANITPVTTTGAGGEAKFSNLPLGYYVVSDTTNAAALPQGEAVSALVLDTTNLNVEVKLKTSKSTLTKKIDGNNDDDNDSTGMVDANKGNIGDEVPYVLTTKVPNMTGYNSYWFVVNDTLSAGLTFNDNVAITVGGTELHKDVDFTVASTKNADGTTSVEIVFVDFYAKQLANQRKDIVITYSATINSAAVIGVEGNPNGATLTYSNKPSETYDGDKPGSDDGNRVGTTPEDKTYTYVTGIVLNKVDEDGNALAGAEFQITGTKQNKYLVYTQSFTAAEDGTYYKLKDGTYTTEAPDAATADLYDSTTTKYTMTTESHEEVMGTEKLSFNATVGADGVLKVDGMEAGTYTITEIKAPTGYNLLGNPVTLTINWTAPANVDVDHNCSWTANESSTAGWAFVDGRFEIDIENKAGTELPTTGGIGTTIFYIVGAVLMAGAAILLITKKRMSAE